MVFTAYWVSCGFPVAVSIVETVRFRCDETIGQLGTKTIFGFRLLHKLMHWPDADLNIRREEGGGARLGAISFALCDANRLRQRAKRRTRAISKHCENFLCKQTLYTTSTAQ